MHHESLHHEALHHEALHTPDTRNRSSSTSP
jgi:hypothetical protein